MEDHARQACGRIPLGVHDCGSCLGEREPLTAFSFPVTSSKTARIIVHISTKLQFYLFYEPEVSAECSRQRCRRHRRPCTMLIIVMRHHLSDDLSQILKIAKVVTEAAGKLFRSLLAAQKKSRTSQSLAGGRIYSHGQYQQDSLMARLT